MLADLLGGMRTLLLFWLIERSHDRRHGDRYA
jgi:hypothetical protein